MQPLSSQNVEAELSYAYIHAVAAHAGMACEVAGRHHDNAGVDAQITAWGPFPQGGYRHEVDIKVQLKATVSAPATIGNFLSYSLSGIARYNDLRSAAVATPRILVVLFLPKETEEWIQHSEESLLLRRCAYWVSLRGAAESNNKTAQTVYLPKKQVFDSSALQGLAAAISRGDIPTYQEPEE
ncbi:DUF4365 domain-containing protein [Sinorhizobium meliloti]|uniref:DUF4365 domain-containing protein n=1 Tax=Rhizobium meliloti TaxID=382 RepID=UPI00299E9858|nr:DUF4365 domain-containing protein [Sinorhizobium meliloti]MDW9897723.1 DUF4365 domain-containing protein [Sinorhizobium meliloti]MDX0345432.1 DUF4365 domain-containing protein [Sinorhizobium meliloti]MDX0856774.1 DUF4365 domain-containing protein [Sinorhizobium medicae]MDX1211763.1 DUF4365 domain-containing protein [Sinorhizobium medicae]